MNIKPIIPFIAVMFALSVSPCFAANNWDAVAGALGKSGNELPGGVYRVGLPRTDLHVTVDGIVLKPFFALGSWLAFAPAGDDTMVMGDLVLREDEIEPVMKALEESDIDITALHNHLLRTKPSIYYMHISAKGDAIALAKAIGNALALTGTPLGATPHAAVASVNFDTAAIDNALGVHGKSAGGVYQVAIPRSAPVLVHGMTISPTMGVSEAINFESAGKETIAITGDFVLTAREVNPVIKALRENDIEVTALHNHMLEEEPRLFFVHFWAHDNLGKILTGLKTALSKIAIERDAVK